VEGAKGGSRGEKNMVDFFGGEQNKEKAPKGNQYKEPGGGEGAKRHSRGGLVRGVIGVGGGGAAACLVLLLGVCECCTHKAIQPDRNSEIGRIFAGLELYDTITDRERASPSPTRLNVVADIAPGNLYRFRQQSGQPMDVQLGCEILPDRLQREGFRVVQKPCDGLGTIVQVEPGGVVYDVVARKGQCELSIFYQTLSSLPWSWKYEGTGKWF